MKVDERNHQSKSKSNNKSCGDTQASILDKLNGKYLHSDTSW